MNFFTSCLSNLPFTSALGTTLLFSTKAKAKANTTYYSNFSKKNLQEAKKAWKEEREDFARQASRRTTNYQYSPPNDEASKAWKEEKEDFIKLAPKRAAFYKQNLKVKEARKAEEARKAQIAKENISFYTLEVPGIPLDTFKKTNEFICNMVNHEVIIDTNIWEDKKLDFFWK